MAVVPVFVSSTFRDFHGERDILAGPVRERLDELVAPLGMRVELIDLRWGVNTVGVTEEQAAQRVLDVCLAEVKRARPLFLGLVGDRLGYVPAAIHARSVATSAGVPESQPVDGLSVTALEFGFGLLWDSAPTGDHVVVFRDLIGDPPPDWSESDPTVVQAFRSEVADYARGRDHVAVAEYQAHVSGSAADLEAVTTSGATISFEDLIFELMTEPVLRRAKQLSDEADAGWTGSERLFRDDHEIIVGRDAMVAEIVDIASAGGKVVAVGESGSGKSTVVCAAEAQLRADGFPVISSLLGASTAGASGRMLVEDLVGQIGQWTGHETDVPADLDIDGLLQWWRDVLHETVSTAGEFVIVVDALDAFVSEPERSDVWPVRGLPPGVGLITSTTLSSHAQILEHSGATRIVVDDLPGPTAAAAAEAWSSASKRELPSTVLDHIGESPRQALWVRLAVDLVGDLDGEEFASIAHVSDQAEAIADLLTDRARTLPPPTEDLVGVFLDTVADRLDTVAASVLLGALAVSRSGLAPTDLAALLPDDTTAQVTVATLRRVLGGQLREADPTGRLTFSHSIVRSTAAKRAPQDIHTRIVRVLDNDNTWDSTDALDVVWHAIHSGGPESAAPLARALNQRPTGIALTLMRALQAHPTGMAVMEALEPDHLDASGLESLLVADRDWGAETLGLRSRTRYANLTLTLARATANQLGQRHVMWAAGNLGSVLTAAGDLPAARTAYTEFLTISRDLAAAQPDALQPRRDITVALDNIGRVATAMGDLPTAHTAHTESLTIRRDLAAIQPNALQPLKDLAHSLNALASTADENYAHALQLEEQEARIKVFSTLRDFKSALALARLDLKIDTYISDHPTSDPNSPVHAYHLRLLREIENLLVILDNAQPLPDDLRSELTRVRRTLAELEAAAQNPTQPNTEADPQ